MSQAEQTPDQGGPVPEKSPSTLELARTGRWFRHAVLALSGVGLALLFACLALFLWASSPSAQNQARLRMIHLLEQTTGGRVEIAKFRWNLFHLSAEADGITIHGLEAANEQPYAHADRVRVEAGVYGLFVSGVSPRVVLHTVDVDGPSFHWIVYADGTTNQPHPRRPAKPGKPLLDTLFDLRIGDLSIRRGVVRLANQTVPVDFSAHDTTLSLGWFPTLSDPAASAGQEQTGTYRIQLALKELELAQGPLTGKTPPMVASLEVRGQLARNRFDLEDMRLTTFGHSLRLRGYVQDFTHPVWHGEANGELDVKAFTPAAGFPFFRAGVATVSMRVDGRGADYYAEGDLEGNHVHYKDPIVDARADMIRAHFRANPAKLLVSDIVTQLPQGGEIHGEFFYDNWLYFTPLPGSAEALRYRREHKKPPTSTGRVRASLNNVPLDSFLLDLASPQFQHLGFGTLVSGETTTTWTGLAYDLAIESHLRLNPSGVVKPGEVPVHGSLDGTYYAGRGEIDVQSMDIHLPRSTVLGNGTLGVFPIDRPSRMNLDVTSGDLREFDATLRALELKVGDRVGADALPARFTDPTLSGEGHFQGLFTSAWLTPRVEGHLVASKISLEIPDGNPKTPPRFLSWDAVDAVGVYTPASITVRHATLRRGEATVTLQGHIDTADPKYNLANTADEFDENSYVQVKADANQFPIGDLLPLAGIHAPVNGKLTTHLSLLGKVKSMSGSSTVDIREATAYGEHVDRIEGAATLQNQVLDVTSLSAVLQHGIVHAHGSVDMGRETFNGSARGAGIDLAQFEATQKAKIPLTGVFGFTVSGSGSLKDPHLDGKGVVSGITLSGEPFSDLTIHATTEQHRATYDLSSHQEAGDFKAHGVTDLSGDMETRARLDFSKFDVGAVLKLLHVTGINGQSDLEGTGEIFGPLAHPKRMNGEANLKQFDVTVQGVHLSSKGAVHGVLANGIAHLDPMEVTGEDTDIKVKGSVQFVEQKQLDVTASGAVNMRLAESLDSDLISSGSAAFQIQANGTLLNPSLRGEIAFHRGAIALRDFPNGLSEIEGQLEFNQNRLEVRTLTAMSGGGQLQVGGYLGFQRTLYADLNATGKGIRIRYPRGVSSLANATLRLQGPQNNLLLSGNVLITRFALNSDLDIAALTSAQSAGVQPVLAADAPSNHLRLDIHLMTAPQLTFQNAFNAKLAGDADLHLRGTLASPSLLGRISLTEGSASIGGTQYVLQRGDISFTNPVRIEPNIDLDASARVEDYDIILGLHGTPDRLKISYRSEPPLPETDVIALLTQGMTTEEQPMYTQQQQQAGDNPTTDLLLGGALNATVSNRVQRLFGSGAVKVDPNFIGSIGNSSARVTVVEQIGSVTFTFASNVNTTAQQLIQAEYAVNRHVSLLITQDENGIFSVVLKTRRRYR